MRLLFGRRIAAGLLALLAAVGGVAVAPLAAQTPVPDDTGGPTCPIDATTLVAVVTASTDPGRAALVGDLAHQLASIRNRRIELIVGWAGAVFEPVAPWEQVTPGSAPRLAGLVNQAAESGVVSALDPTELLDQVVDAVGDRAGSVATATCTVVVVDPGDTDMGPIARDDVIALDDVEVVVLTADRAGLVADLAVLAGAIRGGATDIETISVCGDAGCEGGTAEIALPAVLGGFAITVVLPAEDASVLVGLPRGASFPVAGGSAGQINAGSFDIRTSSPAPDVVRLEADVSPTEPDWPGVWTISVVGSAGTGSDGTALVVTSARAGVVPQFAGSVRLAAGRSVNVRAEIVDDEGRLISDAQALEAIDLRVIASGPDGTELAAAEMEAAPSGVWNADLRLAAEDDIDRATLSLVATIDGGRAEPIEVAAETVSDVLPAAVWPSVAADPIVLQADAGDRVTGTVTVTAGAGVDACAWIEDSSINLGGVAVPVALAGGARSLASCVLVPADTAAALPVSFDLEEVTPGAYSGAITLAYGPRGDEAFETTEIELAFEVIRPVNFVRRVQITVGMSLIALVVPLLALWVLDWLKARFRPPRRAVAAEAWISVWSDGSIYRVDTDGSPLLLGDDQFAPAGLTRSRRFKWRGLDLWVRNPTSPLSPPMAVVGSPTGPVVASMGALVDEGTVVGRVPLSLAPTWIFELETESTREAALDPTAPDFFAAYGRLIIIRQPEAPPVDLRDLGTMAQRLALTVRRAARPAEGTAQDMLAFVEDNVSQPRDLPRRAGVQIEADQPDHHPVAAAPSLAEPDDPYDFSDLAGLFASDEDAPDGHASDSDAPNGHPPNSNAPNGNVPDDQAPADQAPADPASADPASADEAEISDTPFGIVFEESVNVDAFLSASGRELTLPADAEPADAEPADIEPVDAPDPRTSWARRAKPSWPTIRRDRDG